MAKTASAKKKKQPPSKKGKAIVASVLVLGVAIGAIALAVNLGGLARIAVEKIASNTLGVKVTIAKLDISLQEKQIEVHGLRIGNPEGYKNPQAITVEKISLAASDITQSLLVFDEVRVIGTDMNLEVTSHETNLTDLRDGANKNAGEQAQKNGKAPKIIIRDLRIESPSVTPKATLSNSALDPVKLPDIRITGIGEKTNGATVPEAIAQILDICTQVAMKTSIQSGFLRGMDADSLTAIQTSVGIPANLTDQIKDLSGKVRELFGD